MEEKKESVMTSVELRIHEEGAWLITRVHVIPDDGGDGQVIARLHKRVADRDPDGYARYTSWLAENVRDDLVETLKESGVEIESVKTVWTRRDGSNVN
jgi:hypothetical protein